MLTRKKYITQHYVHGHNGFQIEGNGMEVSSYSNITEDFLSRFALANELKEFENQSFFDLIKVLKGVNEIKQVKASNDVHIRLMAYKDFHAKHINQEPLDTNMAHVLELTIKPHLALHLLQQSAQLKLFQYQDNFKLSAFEKEYINDVGLKLIFEKDNTQQLSCFLLIDKQKNVSVSRLHDGKLVNNEIWSHADVTVSMWYALQLYEEQKASLSHFSFNTWICDIINAQLNEIHETDVLLRTMKELHLDNSNPNQPALCRFKVLNGKITSDFNVIVDLDKHKPNARIDAKAQIARRKNDLPIVHVTI